MVQYEKFKVRTLFDHEISEAAYQSALVTLRENQEFLQKRVEYRMFGCVLTSHGGVLDIKDGLKRVLKW